MGFFLLLAFSPLFTTLVPAKESPYSFCSSKLRAHHPHLKASQGSIRLPLHHPRSPCSPAPLPSAIPFSTVLLHDRTRIISLYSRRSKQNQGHPSPVSPSSSTASPLFPGKHFGIGSYVSKIRLGSPSSSYAMIVDTGSSLSWLQCSPCNVSCHDQVGPIFDPSTSTTYSSISCSECSLLPAATHNPYSCSATNVCMYHAIYADGSLSIGNLGRDTLKLGSVTIPKFIYGCGRENKGLLGRTAGLIGLARNNLSLLAQVSKKTGAHAFSYCLPTARSTGFLSLGPYAASKFTFTPLVRGFFHDSFYSIKLASIKLNNKTIPVPSSSYDTPIIIDSGTVTTRLQSDIYSALKHTLTAALKKKKISRAGSYSILDTCFLGRASKIALPEVSMVFEGGAEIKLAARNVMIDVDDMLTCLAFAESTSVSLLGSRLQQTFSVVYDVGKGRIGFASGGCG